MNWIPVKSINDLPSGRILVSMKCNDGKPYVETAYVVYVGEGDIVHKHFRIYDNWFDNIKQTIINRGGEKELLEIIAYMKFPDAYEGE